MTFMAEATPADETAAWGDDGAGGDKTAVVDGMPSAVPAGLAWSAAEADTDLIGRRSWRLAWGHATVIAAIGMVVALAIGVVGWTTLQAHRDDTPAASLPIPAIVAPAPQTLPPALLNGAYRIFHDWDHQTYRGNKTRGGVTVQWTHEGESQITWWAFSSICNGGDCVASAVKLDDQDHQKAAAPSGTDVLKLVNGVWQDMTPYRVQRECTRISDGAVVGKPWATQGWSFEALPDGSFHGDYTDSTDTDECGDKGDTLVVPIVATRVGPVPAGVLTSAPS